MVDQNAWVKITEYERHGGCRFELLHYIAKKWNGTSRLIFNSITLNDIAIVRICIYNKYVIYFL